MTTLQTVVEMESFLKHARAIMSDEERMGVVTFLAANPESGISLGGGLRKVRIAREGGGKSGGYRTIYVFGGATMPLFVLTVFAKNEKGNLSPTEQAAAVALSKQLLATYAAELESFRAWQRENPDNLAWRKKPATRAQVFLIARLAVARGIESPSRLNRGDAHDWIEHNGGNPRLEPDAQEKITQPRLDPEAPPHEDGMGEP